MEQGNKRLVVCCDGTWNEPDQKVDGNPADETERGARYGDGPLPSWSGHTGAGGIQFKRHQAAALTGTVQIGNAPSA